MGLIGCQAWFLQPACCPVPPASCSLPEATAKLPSSKPRFLKTVREARSTTFEVPHRIQPPPVTMFSRQALLRSARAAAPQRALLGQTRTFAAASSEKVKPPVALFGLDGTYATALVRPHSSDRPIGSVSRPWWKDTAREGGVLQDLNGLPNCGRYRSG